MNIEWPLRSGDTNPKYAVTSIKKKIYHDNPHVVLYALTASTTCLLIIVSAFE